jgi:hypothetical protein
MLFSHWIAAHSSAPPTPSNPTHHLLPALYKASKNMPNYYRFTLKMVNAMFVKMLDNSQHLTQLTPESQNYTK